MGTVSEKTLARIMKVFRLHQEGVGGEKVNASALLEKLLKENKLTMADLEEKEEILEYTFPVWNRHQQKILDQCVWKVIPEWDGSYWKRKNSDKRIYRMTCAQHAEIAVFFSMYKKDLEVVINRAVEAFIQANRIFPALNKQDVEEKQRTLAEIEEIEKMLRFASGIEPTVVRKQIG